MTLWQAIVLSKIKRKLIIKTLKSYTLWNWSFSEKKIYRIIVVNKYNTDREHENFAKTQS